MGPLDLCAGERMRTTSYLGCLHASKKEEDVHKQEHCWNELIQDTCPSLHDIWAFNWHLTCTFMRLSKTHAHVGSFSAVAHSNIVSAEMIKFSMTFGTHACIPTWWPWGWSRTHDVVFEDARHQAMDRLQELWYGNTVTAWGSELTVHTYFYSIYNHWKHLCVHVLFLPMCSHQKYSSSPGTDARKMRLSYLSMLLQ